MYSNSYENIRMMFWNGTEKAQDGNIIQYKQYKLDQEGIKHSIWRALKDYTARTDEKKRTILPHLLTKCLKPFLSS